MPEVVVNPYHFFIPDGADGKVKGVRGRDRGKIDFEWEAVERVYEFEDGWYIGWVKTPEDQNTLGVVMGHCSGSNYVWTCEEKIWYFLALFDPEGVPHSTIHAKQASWMNKTHPRDTNSVPIPESCRTWGKMYPSLREVKECFKAAGLEYEPGKYAPPRYASCTYDDFHNYADQDSFSYRYGGAQVLQRKPEEVSKEVWDAYTKAAKAVEDDYDRFVGRVKVVGRRFKFDGKWLILLSATNKSQGEIRGNYSAKIAEWLNSTNRKEK